MKPTKFSFKRLTPAVGLAAMLAVAGVLFVCDPNISTPDVTISTSSNDGTSTQSPKGDTPPPPSGNDKNPAILSSFVGWGVNLFNGRTYSDALKRPLFNDKVYAGVNSVGGNSYITVATKEDLHTTFESSEDASDVYTKLDLKVSLKVKVPFFSGGFKTQFSTDKTLKSNSLFYNCISSTTNKIHTLNSQYAVNIRTIIDSTTLAAINNNENTPEYLFDYFGTHIIVSNGVGGSINVSGVYNSDEKIDRTELSAAINAGSKFVSGEASGAAAERTAEIQSSTSITVKATGGKTGEIGASLTLKDGDLWNKVNTWSKTISENPTLSNIYQLIAIWELATEKSRREQIEAYFYSRANELNDEINGYFTKKEGSPVIVNGGVYVIQNMDSRKAIQADTTVLTLRTAKGGLSSPLFIKPFQDSCNALNGTFIDNTGSLGILDLKCVSINYNVTLQPFKDKSNPQRWVAVEDWDKPGTGTFYFKNVSHGDHYLYAKNLTDSLSLAPRDFTSNNLKFNVAKVNDGGKESVIIRSALDNTYKVSVKAGKANTNGAHLYLETGSETRTKWVLEKVDQVDPSTLNKQRANL